MKKPTKPGWYWVIDTGTGESIKMWWNGIEYLDQDEVNEFNEDLEPEPDDEI